jgi:hypothetical protein
VVCVFPAKSAVYAHVNASMAGLVTIRANQSELQFEEEFDRVQDVHTSTVFLCLATSRWLGILIDLMTNCFVGVVALTLVFTSTSESGTIVPPGSNIESMVHFFPSRCRSYWDLYQLNPLHRRLPPVG